MDLLVLVLIPLRFFELFFSSQIPDTREGERPQSPQEMLGHRYQIPERERYLNLPRRCKVTDTRYQRERERPQSPQEMLGHRYQIPERERDLSLPRRC